MHRFITRLPTHPISCTNSTRSYATKRAVRLNKDAAKDYANDGSGKHPHIGSEKCTVEDCESKECPTLCGDPTKFNIKGHNTHKPPIGRFCRFVSEEDAKGEFRAQYYVKTNKKTEMTQEEKQQYGKNIKADPATQAYVEKYKDKYE